MSDILNMLVGAAFTAAILIPLWLTEWSNTKAYRQMYDTASKQRRELVSLCRIQADEIDRIRAERDAMAAKETR